MENGGEHPREDVDGDVEEAEEGGGSFTGDVELDNEDGKKNTGNTNATLLPEVGGENGVENDSGEALDESGKRNEQNHDGVCQREGSHNVLQILGHGHPGQHVEEQMEQAGMVERVGENAVELEAREGERGQKADGRERGREEEIDAANDEDDKCEERRIAQKGEHDCLWYVDANC